MTTCATCRQEYDESTKEAVKEHTEPVYCDQTNRCGRCYGQPSCYFCQSSFCYCVGSGH